MSKGKKSGIIAGCVIAIVIAIIVKIAISIPESPPTSETDGQNHASAEFTITDIQQIQHEGTLYKVQMTLLDFLRGEQASTLMEEFAIINEPLNPGFEYLLAHISLELLESWPSRERYQVSQFDFYSFSGDVEEYGSGSRGGAVLYYPSGYREITDTLYPGESCEGWRIFQVPVDDGEPLMGFGQTYLGYTDEHGGYEYSDDGLWFKLYDSSPQQETATGLGYDRSEPAPIDYPLTIWVDSIGRSNVPQDPVNEGWWSEYAYLDYGVKNDGDVYIRYYKVSFIVTYDDGTQHEDWTNGTFLLPGEPRSARTIIKGESKEIVAVEVSDYELVGDKIPEVIYEITGTAETVFVTLSNATGGTQQYSTVYLPERYAFTSFPDSYLYISAQNEGASGTVRVSIYVNGELFKTASSSGAYVIATASGSK